MKQWLRQQSLPSFQPLSREKSPSLLEEVLVRVSLVFVAHARCPKTPKCIMSAKSSISSLVNKHPLFTLQLSLGICYEITKQLLLHGVTAAIICGRRETFLQKASATLSSLSGQICLYKVCDVRNPDACKAVVDYAVQQFGRVDILVNGAAGNFLAEAKNLSPKGFKTVRF
jgi:hypothetical protein